MYSLLFSLVMLVPAQVKMKQVPLTIPWPYSELELSEEENTKLLKTAKKYETFLGKQEKRILTLKGPAVEKAQEAIAKLLLAYDEEMKKDLSEQNLAAVTEFEKYDREGKPLKDGIAAGIRTFPKGAWEELYENPEDKEGPKHLLSRQLTDRPREMHSLPVFNHGSETFSTVVLQINFRNRDGEYQSVVGAVSNIAPNEVKWVELRGSRRGDKFEVSIIDARQ